MSVGALLAILVLGAALLVMVFKPAAPDWLPYALDAMLAVAILLSPFPVKWPNQS